MDFHFVGRGICQREDLLGKSFIGEKNYKQKICPISRRDYLSERRFLDETICCKDVYLEIRVN